MEHRKSIESTWKKSNKQRLKEKEVTIPGLAEATEYEFRVFAENERGLSRPRRTATCVKTKLSGKTSAQGQTVACIVMSIVIKH